MEKNYTVDYFAEAHKKVNSIGVENYIRQLLPNYKKEGQDIVALNPTRNDKNLGSFRINVNTGKWIDHATGEGGGDAISLTAYVKGLRGLTRQADAAKVILGKELGNKSFKETAVKKSTTVTNKITSPAPHHLEMTADFLTSRHKKIFSTNVTLFNYHDDNNVPVGCVVRCDANKKKQFLQYSYSRDNKEWTPNWKGGNKPLYNLREILTRLDANVMVVEGEKAAESAKTLFPQYVITTSSSGASNHNSTNWLPLKGREIIIAPDNDQTGAGYEKKVTDTLKRIGVKRIQRLDPKKLGLYVIKNNKPELREGDIFLGYDLADSLADGWTAELINEYKENTEFTPFFVDIIKTPQEREGLDWEDIKLNGFDYRLSKQENSLECKLKKNKREDDDEYEYQKISGYIKPTHCTEDYKGNHGVSVNMITRRGKNIDSFLCRAEIANERLCTENLLKKGLEIPHSKSSYTYPLSFYINNYKPEFMAIGVDSVGWQRNGDVYLLPYSDAPKNCYKSGDAETAEYILASSSVNSRLLEKKGSFESWQNTVGAVAKKNNLFMFAIIAALTAPILKLLNEDGFVFHFTGSSSIGKSTLLYVAGSVWGLGKPSSYRSTDNGFETTCKHSNDGLLLMDEIAEATAETVGYMSYMFGNGSGKQRAGKDGTAKEVSKFTVLGLSTGEIGLEAKLAEKNKESTAGQLVRYIEIDADMEKGYKTFDFLHPEFKDGQAQAQYLKDESLNNCGYVIDRFLTELVKDTAEFIRHVKSAKKDWLGANLKEGKTEDPQVQRVAQKFAICYAVGTTAVGNKWLPFTLEEITDCFKSIFENWLSRRGGTDSHELNAIKKRIIKLVTEKSHSKFLDSDGEDDKKSIEIAGYKKQQKDVDDNGKECVKIIEYWVYPNYFQREVLQGKKGHIKKLAQDLFIKPESEKEFTAKRQTKHGRARYYVIPANIVSEDE